MYCELNKLVPSIVFSADSIPAHPAVTIMSVIVDENTRYADLAAAPHHRIDLVNTHTAERAALWLRFSDFSFDATKQDFDAMFRLCINWIDNMLAFVRKQHGDDYILLGESTQYNGASRNPKEDAGRMLWSAITDAFMPEDSMFSVCEGATLYSRFDQDIQYYQITVQIGRGAKVYLTKKGGMGDFFGATGGYGYSGTAPSVKPQATTTVYGVEYDVMFVHPMFGEQIFDRFDKLSMSLLFLDKLKERLPFMLHSREHFPKDWELNWDANLLSAEIRTINQRVPVMYNQALPRW